MNKKDFIVMAHLRRNARETLTRMSRKTNIPISTIYDKLKMHEGSTITKHTCLIDFNHLGFSTRANVMLKVDRTEREKLLASLMNNLHINSIYKISNGYDFLIETVFRNVKDLEDFLDALEMKFRLKDKQVYYVIEDLKRESFLSDPETIDLIISGL